jgi:GntR family transcriptional regulator
MHTWFAMIFHVNPASGVPIYVQLMEQLRHGLETGALRAGEQLPPLRKIAEDLVINPNTVARAYRELEREGVIEIHHGSGAFVTSSAFGLKKISRGARAIMQNAVERLAGASLTEDEIRRLLENELSQLRQVSTRSVR